MENLKEKYMIRFIPYLVDIDRKSAFFVPSIFKTHKVGGIFISFLLKGGGVIWEYYEGVICCSESGTE